MVAFLSGVVACGGADGATSDDPLLPTSSAPLDAAAAPASPDAPSSVPAQMLDAGTRSIPDAGASSEAAIKDSGLDAMVSRDAGSPPQQAAGDAMTIDADGMLHDSSVTSSEGGQPIAGDAGTGADASLSAGAKVVHVDSKVEWTASGFQVTAGKCYVVRASIDDQWLDLDVKADLNGWIDTSNALYGLFADLRRVADPSIAFYQFAACVDRNLDACFAIGNGATICPHQSGELVFFVNDVPGFEDNNVGTATVTIEVQN
jgi:hypothetical protein